MKKTIFLSFLMFVVILMTTSMSPSNDVVRIKNIDQQM
jgi:hypothetical protein